MANIGEFHRYHLGCGGVFIRGFLNIDLDHNLQPETIYLNHKGIEGAHFFNHDLRKGLPGENNTLEIIYHCHFLEHLSYPEALELLRQSHLRLRPGGRMRVVVPDLELWIQNYVNGNTAFFDGYRRQILQNNHDLYKTKAAVFMGMLHNHGHRWGYDYETLHWLLERAGFDEIRRLLFQESSIPEIRIMEPYTPLRGMESLCIECIKVANPGYAIPLAITVQPVEARKAFFKGGEARFEVGRSYPTVQGTLGSLALVRGWSHPEDAHTWSDGERATLIFTVSSDPSETGDLLLGLQGWVTAGPWMTRIFVEGKLVKTIRKSANEARQVDISIPLAQAVLVGNPPIIQVDCLFEYTYCQFDNIGAGDKRHLSFALQSLRIGTVPYDTTSGTTIAALRELLERRSPRITAVVVGDDHDAGTKVPRFLQAAGLAGC